MARPQRFVAFSVILAAGVVGITSGLAFGWFLLVGPPGLLSWTRTTAGALAFDLALSLAFFVQHSGMVRKSFQDRLVRLVPRHQIPVTYGIASGLVLIAVVVFWQPTNRMIWSAGDPLRWFLWAIIVTVIAGFIWGVASLGSFDALGLNAVRARLTEEPPRGLPLTIRGPYRFVRHPLYTFALTLFWCTPDLSADRLLFNVTWTLWVWAGTILEERDLVAAFGEDYRRYQKQVPMLFPVPWLRAR